MEEYILENQESFNLVHIFECMFFLIFFLLFNVGNVLDGINAMIIAILVL